MADTDLSDEDTRRLSRREADALIGQRLAALGHMPDFISAEARDEIIARGAGSFRQTRRALSATLFLASTEDLPRVEAEHVCRAVPAEPGDLTLGLEAAPSVRLTRRIPYGIVTILAALALCTLLTKLAVPHLEPPRPPQGGVVALPQTLTLPAKTIPPAVAPSLIARIAELTVPRTPDPALPDLPVAPPADILLLMPPGSGPDHARFAPVREALRQAGFDYVREAAASSRGHCHGVCFFFTEDAGLAARIAELIASSTNARAAQNPVAAKLLFQSPERPPRPPGSIDINVW